ncbi:hypothetical protein BDF19DRAFT_438336 [Syncephalis fuscata]|nr:hypothetical protein BDF19DRAFT_438336 [Syncephalis fuscata]
MASMLRTRSWLRPSGLLGRVAITPFNQSALLRPLAGLTLTSTRTYASHSDPRQNHRLIVTDHGLIDPFVPLPRSQRPSIFSRAGFRTAVKHWKNIAFTTFCIGRLRMSLDGWKPKPFAMEAQEMYEWMNNAFARGAREELREICTENMFSRLKNDMKNRVGTYKWTLHGQVEPPRVVTARYGQMATKLFLAQVTVRIHTKQSMAVYNKKVFQRVVGPGERNGWKIYGKVQERPVIAAP